jgi:hypothetical protein
MLASLKQGSANSILVAGWVKALGFVKWGSTTL